jgi:hypothetical protein
MLPTQLVERSSHCNACKKTSGGDFTLNTIIAADNLKFTKGEDQLKKYTYKGDSGRLYTHPIVTSTH